MKTVLIQQELLFDLERKINEWNVGCVNDLKLDVAVYFLSLIISMPTFNRERDIEDYSVRLSSKKLKGMHHKYSDYITFLIDHGFILKKKNYSTDKGTCNTYQICEHYLSGELQSYVIKDKFLLKRFKKNGQTKSQVDKMEYVRMVRPHLVSGFNNLLTIDFNEAYEEVNCFRNSNKVKYLSSSQMINEWHQKEWNYSIKPETDNRLHSTLTRTNRVLRKHINYNGECLGAADIKTSQPYFLCAILKGVINKDEEYLQLIGAMDIINDELLTKLFKLNLDIENARHFVDLVLHHDLYDNLIGIIPIQCQKGKPYRMVWPNGKWGESKIPKLYKSKRDLVKEVVLEVFNGSVNSRKTEVVAFKKEFHCIDKLLKCINAGGVEVYRLLSHVEAYCLLDVVAKHISSYNPEMPLFSIHDSLVTTQNNLESLGDQIYTGLKHITGLQPTIKLEYWGAREYYPSKKSS